MDKEEAMKYIKEQLQSYLNAKGINTTKKFKCLNPAHQDRNPSMNYDKNRNKVHCFSCGEDYDIFDLIGIDYNMINTSDIFKKAYEIYGIDITVQKPLAKKVPVTMTTMPNGVAIFKEQSTIKSDYTSYIMDSYSRVEETEYFKHRGISQNIIDRCMLGYDSSYKCGLGIFSAVILPYNNDFSYYIARLVDEHFDDKGKLIRYIKPGTDKAGAEPIFNVDALYNTEGKPVFITEGQFDALSILEVGAEAIAIGGTGYRKLLNQLEKQQTDNTLIIALDNDEAGKNDTQKLQNELQHKCIKHTICNITGNYKDANEALIADRNNFKNAVLEAQDKVIYQLKTSQESELAEYLNTSAKHSLKGFINGIANSINTPFIPTGFCKLDQVFDGGLYEGLYIVGAISSLGKTTWVLQIADQIAQEGQDVLIFSIEMSHTELMSKSISRNTFLLAKNKLEAKTARGITTGKRYADYSQSEKQLIYSSIEAYEEYASYIYINEGIGTIGVKEVAEITNKHIFTTGKKPIVIIDYLQILEPYDARSSDKQNTDRAVKELKRLSRQHKLSIIAISSFNRESYKNPVNMSSFKESGSVEYSSDVLIGLQLKGSGKDNFDVDEAKKRDPREIEVKILKNRNGATGATIDYKYFPLFNNFEEL